MRSVAGFLAGAYIPPGTLPDTVVDFLNVLPFAQSASLIRGPCTSGALDALTSTIPQARSSLEQNYGLTLQIGNAGVTAATGVLLGYTAL